MICTAGSAPIGSRPAAVEVKRWATHRLGFLGLYTLGLIVGGDCDRKRSGSRDKREGSRPSLLRQFLSASLMLTRELSWVVPCFAVGLGLLISGGLFTLEGLRGGELSSLLNATYVGGFSSLVERCELV